MADINDTQMILEENDSVLDVPKIALHGRTTIYTPLTEVTEQNVVSVLRKALTVHVINQAEIEYLYNYYRGVQPILVKKKPVRPEINNKVAENHALEIADFVSGYFLGEPITYVRRGEDEDLTGDIDRLNDYMYLNDKAALDEELAEWLAICGVGYRMVLPVEGEYKPDSGLAPFEIDILDPRDTFVVYNSGFGHKPVMCVTSRVDQRNESLITVYQVYTHDRYYEIDNGSTITVNTPHDLPFLPIFEYDLNMSKLGSFEPAIPVLDAINQATSGRLDGLEQFVQSFLKFKNVEIDEEKIGTLKSMGAISFKSYPGMDGDVSLISSELNQEQIQCFIDYLYDKALIICGLPTTTKGGSSTSDTGAAVILRDGFVQAESKARKTEMRFKKAERSFLALVLAICSNRNAPLNINLNEVECKFTRRQHDNLQSKVQALLGMLQAGLNPEVAIANCGLFNDPMDVAIQSRETLRKWDFIPMSEEPTQDEEGGETEVTGA